MPQFLSEEWVAACNAALAAEPASPPSASVRAQSGSFSVEELVSGVPGRPEDAGPLRVVLRVVDGTVSLALQDDEAAPADVVVSLRYEDAAALATGDLDPAHALGTGRIRVRGDLAVLLAGQALLAAAAARLGEPPAHPSDR